MKRYIDKKIAITGLITVLVPYSGFAQQENGPEEVEIWGTRVNSSSVFLGEDQIAIKQADHLSDLLRDLPGVDIGGSHSTNQRINIRGLDDTDLNVRIDGASQNNYMYHHMGNLLVNADILKAVDVQVGANSIITGGIGGGVSFETKDARDLLNSGDSFGARAQTSVHSNAMQSYSLTAYSQLTDSVDAIGYFSYADRDNFEDGDGVEVFGNDGEIENFLLKLGADISDNQRLGISYDSYQDEGLYAQRPDMGVSLNLALTPGILFPTEYGRDTFTLNYQLDKGDALNLRATAYDNQMELQRTDLASLDLTTGESSNSGINVLGRTRISSGGIAHTLNYGGEYSKQETYYQRAPGGGGPLVTDLQKANNMAFYVEDVINLNDRLSLTPGARLDLYDMETSSNNNDYENWSFALTGEYQLTDELTFRAGRVETFKGPELSEIFTGAGIGNAQNPDLEPESGHSDEIGLRYLGYNIAGADTFSAGLTVFRTQMENKIEEQDYPLDSCVGRGCPGWYTNVGEVEITGAEASIGLSKQNFSMLVSYSTSDSEINTTGEPLEREIGDSIGLSLDYAFPSIDLTLNWNSRILLDEDESTTGTKEGFDIHNISVRWAPAALTGATLTFGVDNLFDTLYVSHASRVGSFNHPVFGLVHLDDYEPGRNVKATLSYQF